MIFDDSSDSAAAQHSALEKVQRTGRRSHNTSFLDHLNASDPQYGFKVTLVDGTAYEAVSIDCIFTDGLSIVVQDHRIYLPQSAITQIRINNAPRRI